MWWVNNKLFLFLKYSSSSGFEEAILDWRRGEIWNLDKDGELNDVLLATGSPCALHRHRFDDHGLGDIYSDHNILVILWYCGDIYSYLAESMAMVEDYASDKFDNLAQKYIMVACCHWVNNSLFLFILQRACSDAKSTVYWWFHSYWTLWSVAECFLVQHPQTTKELAAFSAIGSISAARKKWPVKMLRKCSISIIF